MDDDITWSPDGTLTHIGQPDWLAQDDVQRIMRVFEDAGHEIYAVGGCVRDTVLRHRVKDVDLSTDATPDIITRLVEGLSGWKAVPTGADHGTITAVGPATTLEITTFRTDIETDGRHAVVAFSDRVEDDANRRDFTINAFYADRAGRVIDVVGGSRDLRDRRIRFIGDPHARIQEDYLRILRFFRFTERLWFGGQGIDSEGLAACAELAEGMERVSQERIGAEMTRLIYGWDAAPVVGAMEMSGVLGRILPGATVRTLARLVDLENAYPVSGRESAPRDMPTRLAALGCPDVADRLRLSRAEADKIALVRSEAGSLTPPHELGYRHGFLSAVHCLLLRWATLEAAFDVAALNDVDQGVAAVFPIAAADLMPAYIGKALGDRLKMLEAAWIASRFRLSRDALLALP